MATNHATPIVMPMSNPTSKAECTPEQAYAWSDGRAIVATGSPFDPVTLPSGKTLTPSQCNNMYVFPGIGLAASVAGVEKISDGMLYAAAVACVESMTPEEVEDGRTFPDINRIRQVSHHVACAVIKQAFNEGIPTRLTPKSDQELAEHVLKKMYFPAYAPLIDPSV